MKNNVSEDYECALLHKTTALIRDNQLIGISLLVESSGEIKRFCINKTDSKSQVFSILSILYGTQRNLQNQDILHSDNLLPQVNCQNAKYLLQDMTPLSSSQIIGLLRYKTGKTVSEWAKQNGFHKTNVYRAINGETANTIIHKIIADDCNKSITEIWPEPAKEEGKKK